MREPQDPFNRYAFGFTDKKPGWTYWLIQACIFGGVVYLAFERGLISIN